MKLQLASACTCLLWESLALPTLFPPNAAVSFFALRFGKKTEHAPSLRRRQDIPSALTEASDGEYYIDVEFGTPPQQLSLVLDTGSPEIWGYAPESQSSCPACTTEYYDPSLSSSVISRSDLGTFEIDYASANPGVTGYYVNDVVEVGGVAANITIGVATTANPNDPPGGIFGVSPSAGHTSVAKSGTNYPSYVESLVSQGIIGQPAFSIYLDPNTATTSNGGTIIFGGYDPSKYTETPVAFQLIEPAPAPDNQYRFDIRSPVIQFTLGGETYTVPQDPYNPTVVLDTGTPVTRLPTDQVAAIANTLGGKLDTSGSVPIYSLPCPQSLDSDFWSFTFSGSSGTVSIDVPWSEIIFTTNTAGVCELGLIPEAENIGDYTLGDNILRSMYLIYNYPASYLSIAQASADDSCSDCVLPLP